MSDVKTVEIQPPKPHSRKQELIMRAFLFPEVREVFVACGSKFGKSLGAATCLTNAVMNKHGGRWRWLAPLYRQSKIGMDYFSKLVPPSPHSEFSYAKMRIDFPLLDSNIEFMHTQTPVDLEGAAIDGQIGDEAAKMPYQAYVSARTTQTFTRGPSMWVSTPYGKNWFYKRYMECKEQMEWAISKGQVPTVLAIHAPTISNPFVHPDVIAQAKQDLPDRLFRQYYGAEFCDESSIFIGYNECSTGPELEFESANQHHWLHADHAKASVVIGADWAKVRDYAVFVAIDYNATPKKVVGFQRFHGISYVAAVKELYQFSKNFKQVSTIWHDKTGVGEALDDMLGHFPLPFMGFTFSNQSKASIVNGLGLTFEKKDIDIPKWGILLSELATYEVTVSDTGLMRYNASAGSHDDTVIALGLANAAASEYQQGSFEVRLLDDLPKDRRLNSLERYYNDLISDSSNDSPFGS